MKFNSSKIVELLIKKKEGKKEFHLTRTQVSLFIVEAGILAALGASVTNDFQTKNPETTYQTECTNIDVNKTLDNIAADIDQKKSLEADFLAPDGSYWASKEDYNLYMQSIQDVQKNGKTV